jgi:hypothetical protein
MIVAILVAPSVLGFATLLVIQNWSEMRGVKTNL